MKIIKLNDDPTVDFESGPWFIDFPVKKHHLQNRIKEIRDDEKGCIFKCPLPVYENDENNYNASCQHFNYDGEQIQLREQNGAGLFKKNIDHGGR